jgi:citrate synthase
MPENKLTITDHRTDKTYSINVENGTIRAIDLRQIKTDASDFGLMSYDPAYMNTASTKSAVTFLDGDRGILEYRGYPIEQLAEKCTYLEVAYLLLYGELPNDKQREKLIADTMSHVLLHENIKYFIQNFRPDAHPMGIFISTIAALSTFYPEAKQVLDRENRHLQIGRLIAKVPTIAAFSYRHSRGLPYIYPNYDLSFTENFLNMMFGRLTKVERPNPALVRALDVIFILHADHEQNCSTTAMRTIGSSQVDPYSAMAGAASALYGPLHGGANEAVLNMLSKIGDKKNVPAFVKEVKEGHGKLMGFGHRVYKNYDPRAKIIKKMADEVFAVTGRSPLIDIAIELERIALEDEYFISRKLYPNVDFYSGIICQSMKIPTAMFPVMFAIPRSIGWLAQWDEMMSDSETKIARPRQVYTGPKRRNV